MTRSRASAKAAGSRFVRVCVDWLQEHGFPYAEVAPSWGAADKGDIVNVRTRGGRHIAIENKDYGGVFHVAEWLREAEVERVNDKAVAGVVIAKRRGITDPAEQVCFMTLRDLVAIIREERPE